MWGPAHCVGLNGSRYYLIFVNHDTKYLWFYPVNAKSCDKSIFPQSKKIVEKHFQTSIKSHYSDNDGEFINLKPFLSLYRISHYTIAPHTPQHNGVSECRRRHHRVETGFTLLHDANLPLSY